MNIMNEDMLWAVVRLAVSLPLVLALAYFTVKFGLARQSFVAGAQPRRVHLVEQLSLGPRSGLSLVQVGQCYFLLAHQEGKVTLVKEFAELPDKLPFERQDEKSLDRARNIIVRGHLIWDNLRRKFRMSERH